MSDVVLYGTLPNGEAVRVEANESGQLVAEGLQGEPGQPGQPGPPGEPGPPGPPGEIIYPPDPFEGAVLGWKDGELAWIGVPIPLPDRTVGPITSYDFENGILTVDGGEPSFLLAGEEILLTDNFGAPIPYSPSTSLITSVRDMGNTGYIIYFEDATNLNNGAFQVGDKVQANEEPQIDYIAETTTDMTDTNLIKRMWDGDLNTRYNTGTPRYNGYIKWTPGEPRYFQKFKFKSPTSPYTTCTITSTSNHKIVIELQEGGPYWVGDGCWQIEQQDLAGQLKEVEWVSTSSGKLTGVYASWIDDEILISSTKPSGTIVELVPEDNSMLVVDGSWNVDDRVFGMRLQPTAVLDKNAADSWPLLYLKEDTGGFTVGDYATAPERMASGRELAINLIRSKIRQKVNKG